MPSFGGIDLGGTKIQAVVVDERLRVLGSARSPTPTGGGPKDVAAAIEQAIRQAATEAGVEVASLAGIGVGSPGTVEGGVVTSARNLPGWEGSFPLAKALSSALGPPVVLGNDVAVASAAEFELGAGRPFRSLIGVFWGTGVGGGVILDGKPWRGRGAAGEIGHMVVELNGALCTCGRRGCMEAYAGRAAMEIHAREKVKGGKKTDLFKLAKQHDRPRLTSSIWARALEHGDKLAEHTIERAIQALGAGIASAVNLLDVEAVILGGGLGVRLGEPYAKRIDEAMRPHLFHDSNPPQVLVAALGDLGGATGAALLVAKPAVKSKPAKASAKAPTKAAAKAPTKAAAKAPTKAAAKAPAKARAKAPARGPAGRTASKRSPGA